MRDEDLGPGSRRFTGVRLWVDEQRAEFLPNGLQTRYYPHSDGSSGEVDERRLTGYWYM